MTIGGLLAGPDVDRARLGDLADSLVTGLRGHLRHEEDADPRTTARLLSALPEPARTVYATRWRPAYAALDRWRGRS